VSVVERISGMQVFVTFLDHITGSEGSGSERGLGRRLGIGGRLEIATI
jgi:hypothetical protein